MDRQPLKVWFGGRVWGRGKGTGLWRKKRDSCLSQASNVIGKIGV